MRRRPQACPQHAAAYQQGEEAEEGQGEEILTMLPIRYFLAFFSACLIIAGGAAFCAYLRQSFWEDIRQELRDAKDAGELLAELENIDIENIHLVGLDLELSNQQMFKVQLVDLLAHLWFVWVLVVFGVCFGIAYFLGRTPNLPA